MMNKLTSFKLKQIQQQYNPEFDVSSDEQPTITWAEFALLNAILELQAQLDEVNQRLVVLEEVVK